MSTNSESLNLDELKAILKEKHNKFLKTQFNTILLRSLSVLFAIFVLFVLSEQVFYLDYSVKSFFLLAALAIYVFLFFFGFKNRNKITFNQFYRDFGKQSNLKELTYAIDLEDQQFGSPALIKAAINRNLTTLKTTSLNLALADYSNQSLIYKNFKQTFIQFSLVFLASLITLFFFKDASLRSVNFWTTYEKPNPFQFRILPGDTTLEQGSSFAPTIEFLALNSPKEVNLRFKTPIENEFRTRKSVGNQSTFSVPEFELNSNLEYYFEMDEFESPRFNAFVQLRPRLSELSATVLPPSYTELDSTIQKYPFSLVRAYQGSEIVISGKLNKPVTQTSLISATDTSLISIENSSLTFTTTLKITETDTLSFLIEDDAQLKNQNPFQFVIEAQADRFPTVELIEPSSSFSLFAPKEINLIFKASDDFGITSARLNYELKKAYVEKPISGQIPLQNPRNGVLQNFNWSVSELNLTPLDEVTFWIEAADNDEYSGFKTSRSQLITLTIPSLVDYFEDLDEREAGVSKDLDEITEEFKKMREDYENFKEELKQNPDSRYEQQRQLDEAIDQQKEVEKRIEELNMKFEEIKNELSENKLLSPETQKAYEELKKLMEEIDDPDLREALQKLQERMRNMSPEQMRRAMEEIEFNEENYRERLERTVELFKQVKLMSDMEKLAKSYDEKARQEDDLESENTSSEERAQKRDKDLEELEKLKETLEKLSENETPKTEKVISELQEMSKKELDEIKKKIEKELKELQENSSQENSEEGESDSGEQQDSKPQESSPSSPPQNNSQQFKKLAEDTRSAMKGMSQEQMQINIAGLQYTLYSLITLSDEQEGLVTSTQQTESRSQAYIDYARSQQNIERIFVQIADSLFQLSKDIPGFSNTINTKKNEVERQLTSSVEQMAERNQNRSSVSSRQAFGGINELAFMIANLLEQLQNGEGSGSGGAVSMEQMIEQMQNMGENQQQLNQQMQDFINELQGDRLSNDQMQRLEQMSRQQNEIRKQLQELQQSGGAGNEKLSSELQRLIENMEDTINDLRGGAVNRELINRQQNILSRMLEAQEALQEQDEEEKREGTTGRDLANPSPPELTLEELERQIRARLNDPNFTKYSRDYQQLIERYFELLKIMQERSQPSIN